MVIELRPPVSVSSTKISKFHAPLILNKSFTNTESKPIGLKLGSPLLENHNYKHQLGTC